MERSAPMKRQAMIRRTPLLAKSVLVRRAPFVLGVHTPKRSAAKQPRRVYRPTGPDKATVALVLERAGYMCEVGGTCDMGDRRGVDFSVHHRQARGAGGSRNPGTNRASNLLLACGSGVAGCHGLIENQLRAAAYEVGWLVHHGSDPAAVPALIHRTRWVLLTADGQYIDVPAPAVA